MFGISQSSPEVSWTLYYAWEYKWYFLAAILGSTPLVKVLLDWADREEKAEAGGAAALGREALKLAIHGVVFLLFLLGASELVIGAHNPFIYFNF